MKKFERRLELTISPEELFAWHERKGAFERLTPPWDPVTILYKDDHIKDGALVKLKVKGPMGVPLTLEVIHEDYQEGKQFVDRQIKGPFAYWRHQHLVQQSIDHEENEKKSQLTDFVEYKLPLGYLGQLGGGSLVKDRLNQLFHYRHTVMIHDYKLHQLYQGSPLHIAISGATGLIGTALTSLFNTGGHRVTILTRRVTKDNKEYAREWSSAEQVPNLEDVDLVIHLAGESVAQRWSNQKKKSILNSRVKRTRALATYLSQLKQEGKPGPQALICASGIGYYGDCPDQESWVDESAPLGEGFLAEVCDKWENACLPAKEAGIRVVNARIGIVLSPQGGALGKLLLPFLMGVGGRVSHGQQWMSWISLHDVVGALYFCALKKEMSGPINLSAPQPVTNQTFSNLLAKVLHRPAIFPVPAFVLKMIFGEMAKETILSGQRVQPKKLMDNHYPFLHSKLEDALRFELGKVEQLSKA